MWKIGEMSEQIRQITLSDGRTLAFRDAGHADGLPLVFHHGTPGSLAAVRAIDRSVESHGLRIVTASRAGYGSSSPNPGRTVVDVVADTKELVDQLGIDRCIVAGWSGGGPHALACAARLEEAAAALIIAGVAPFDAEGLDFLDGMGEENIEEFGAAIAGPGAIRSYLATASAELDDLTVASLIESMDSILPEVDKAVLSEEFGADMVAEFVEALRLGYEGWLEDDLAFSAPWGFSLDEITTPTAIWQGSKDLMVPFAHGQWLAAHVPGASAHLLEGEGHLSIALGAIDLMLDELISMATP